MYFVNDLFVYDRMHNDGEADEAPVKTSLDAANSR